MTLHCGELVDDVGQMGGPIRTGAGSGPDSSTRWPVGTTKEASKARTPCRMIRVSRFSGLPGCTGSVG